MRRCFHLRGLAPRETAPSREEWMALVHPDDVSVVLEGKADAAAALLPMAYEFRVRLPDGSYRWLASRSAAVLDDAGRPARRVGVNWDVTESKNAEIARQQAALAEREIQAKSQFLSRMSHELRTPLNAVLGFTQLLQIEARQSAQSAQLAKLEHIRAAGDHLLSLINDVLDLSGLDAGEIRLSMQPVELAELVRQSLPLPAIAGVAARRRARDGRADGIARADPTRLRQVLINLLSNAIKYNRPGGTVRVESHSANGEATLSVRDTGRGLSAEQIASLFEPFNRFGAESEGIEGTGIGLTIVKALVDGMAGRIEVESNLGRGTVFTVTLPAAAIVGSLDPGDTGPDTVPTLGAAGVERSGTILYIEDNAVNVLLVEELVASIGGLAIFSEETGSRRRRARARASPRPRPHRPAAARFRRLRGAAPSARRSAHARDAMHRLVGERDARGHRARPGERVHRLLDQADRLRRLHRRAGPAVPRRRPPTPADSAEHAPGE
jgi:signal transduction histidine kinase